MSVSDMAQIHPQDHTPLGAQYETSTIDPADLVLVPILRSGLGMVDGMI